MSDALYFPLVRTRDAELRCFKQNKADVKDQIIPIYELTKSRKTKKTPDGDIHRRMKQIGDIQCGRPFILDLTTDEQYLNSQILQLLDSQNGFGDWQIFLGHYRDLNIIPMIHLYEDEELSFVEVREFVKSASLRYEKLALRIPYNLSIGEIETYLTPIKEEIHRDCKLIIILDADFIRYTVEPYINDIATSFKQSYTALHSYLDCIEDIVMMATSFPRVPADLGDDDAGNFEIFEEYLFREISSSHSFKYGDYASINTEQVEVMARSFVPRIDISNNSTFFYKRYRRDKGSYSECARKILQDERYLNLNTWADEEIELAAKNTPSGISPSYWISIRMNHYIAWRLKLRRS